MKIQKLNKKGNIMILSVLVFVVFCYSKTFANAKNFISTRAISNINYGEAINYYKKIYKDKNNKEVIIAIIDTGVDYNHPDLKDRIWVNKGEVPGDGIDNDNNGYIDDIYGWDYYNNDNTVCDYVYSDTLGRNIANPKDNDDHGTHVAGIIAANFTENNIMSDIKIKLMILKINGGKDGNGSLGDAVKAIEYATAMGADICNLSWGTYVYNKELEKVMKESDMLFITAAGNNGEDNSIKPIYPGNFKLKNLMTVTFINNEGQLTSRSNYGIDKVDIAAPGERIFSTVVGGYGEMSGTSMAAPHVTALAAILYAYNDGLYAANVKDIILKNYYKINSLSKFIKYPGVPDAAKIVRSNSFVTDLEEPNIEIKNKYNLSKFILSIKGKDSGGSGVRTIRWLKGNKSIYEFARGTKGNQIIKNKIELIKPGKYTFYISDYSGNEKIIVYNVEDDKIPPVVSADYSILNDNETNIFIRVKDDMSGIKRVKYSKGILRKEDMLAKNIGKEVILSDGNKATIKVEKENVYTIFAIDHRGNMTLDYINVKVVEAKEIKLLRNWITIGAGEEYQLKAFLKPVSTTEQVIYKSNNKEIVTVDQKGKIKAKKEGKAVIIVNTPSGLRTICEVHVKK